MGILKQEILPDIRRYFRSLWAALRGCCLSVAESKELKLKVLESNTKLHEMFKLYAMLVEKWQSASEKADKQMQQIGTLQKDIANYQKLIETLRTSIRDKEHELTLQRQQYLELLDKQR